MHLWDAMLDPSDSRGARPGDRGRTGERRHGCFTCHGDGGRGEIANHNYIKPTVPALDVINERMFLYYPEDVEAVLTALVAGKSMSSLEDDPPVPRFSAVLANYGSIVKVIAAGNPAGMADPEGPEPPLHMPAWSDVLDERDVDAIVAYLLSRSLQKLEQDG